METLKIARQTTLGFLVIIIFFSCSTKETVKTTKNISATITLTLQNDSIFFTIIKADSMLASQPSHLFGQEDKNEDERMLNYKKAHPLMGVLFPNIIPNGQGQSPIAHSSFIGYSKIQDTSTVNGLLISPDVKNLFPKNIRYKWTKSMFQTNTYNLSAFVDNNKSISLDSSAIEKIIIEKSGIFKSIIFKTTGAMLDTIKYDIHIALKEETIKKINEFAKNSAVLLSIYLCGEEYSNSLTSDNLSKNIQIAYALSQGTIDCIKTNYSSLIREK